MQPYKQIDNEDISFLKQVCTNERVRLKDTSEPNNSGINEDFSHDEMPEYGKFYPDVMVDVLSAEEISKILAYASKMNLPVTIRGAGTGLCGGCVPTLGGILVNVIGMNKILEIDKKNLIAVVEPGVLLMELAAAVEGEGLLYPPDPGEKSATIGGNAMTNAGGMRAIRYGVTREYIRGMEVVIPSGEILQLGGKIAKTSSGYSLKDLFIGSEGTLGVVTKLELKLIKLPKTSVTLLIPYSDLTSCLNSVPLILNTAETPLTLEFMEKEVILSAEEYLGTHFPDKSANAYLMVSYAGNSKTDIEKIYTDVAEVCLANGALDVFISDTDERKLSIWQPRGAFLEAIKSSTPSMDECDIVVPIESIAAYLKYAKAIAQEHGVRIPSFGHAGDGNLHLYVCKDSLPEDEWKEKCQAVMEKLYSYAQELGGQVSGEHGIGHAKIPFLKESVGTCQFELMKGIKRLFDPNLILNPGKVVELDS